MKNNLLLICGLAMAVLLSACGDDELPKAVAAFEVDADGVPEVGVPVMFDNLSTNADNYEWDFGDGDSSTVVSPTHTYDEAGDFEVILTAITKDGQKTEISEVITIRQRILTTVIINSLEFSKPDGSDWDEDSTGMAGAAPDMFFILSPDSDPQAAIFTTTIPNLTIDQLTDDQGNPLIGFNTSSLGLVLTNETWTMFMVDDFDLDSSGEPTTELMLQVSFNPVLLFSSIVNPDTRQGLMNVAVGGFNVDFFFDLE